MKMFTHKFPKFMFCIIVLLQHVMLQDCAAADVDLISKDESIVTSSSSPVLLSLLRTGNLDSDLKVLKTEPEADILNNEPQNLKYEVLKDTKEKEVGIDSTTDALDAKQSAGNETVSKNETIELSKLVYWNLASALKNRLHQVIAEAFPKRSQAKLIEAHAANISDGTSTSNSSEKAPTGRQFVFHPYLPYGKDVAPDEKISIGDVLPVKMVKFFKGMVEEAPWEQMFQKMVRMIVDQFVDKIIEKMFAHKDDDDDKWRSSDGGSAKSGWSLPKNILTYVVRSRRSTEGKTKTEHTQDMMEKDLSSSNRVSKQDRSKAKEEVEEESWLDSILDYLFPEDPKATDGFEKYRRRRDVYQPSQENDDQLSGIMRSFLARYLKFNTEQQSPESQNATFHSKQPSPVSKNAIVQSEQLSPDIMNATFLSKQPSLESKNATVRTVQMPLESQNATVHSEKLSPENKNAIVHPTQLSPESKNAIIHTTQLSPENKNVTVHTEQLSPARINAIAKNSIPYQLSKMMHRENSSNGDFELVGASPRNNVSETAMGAELVDSVDAARIRRSTSDDDKAKVEDEERLWQAPRRPRPPNRKSREDCSLRRACNAGRLLSRLPSVQDITMQLKAYGNEPHWDALVWGMTKKRCSKIFCKRQRSPKGSKQHWDGPEKRLHRKNTPSSRSSRRKYDEIDLTTIFPV